MTMSNQQHVALGAALLQALGLSDQSVSSVTLHFEGVSAPKVEVRMWLRSLDAEGEFIQQLRQFKLEPQVHEVGQGDRAGPSDAPRAEKGER